MKDQKFDISKLRVASPCSVGWETMTGNERVRHCHSCKLNIYNIAEMTEPEVKNLISTHEGRLCIRLFKRNDGTILTKDCPVGFRAYQKRVARFAGATLATILGFFSISFSQEKKEEKKKSGVEIVASINQSQGSAVKGKVTDMLGAVVPNVEILFSKKNSDKKIKVKTDDNGEFIIDSIKEGYYKIKIEQGLFKKKEYKYIEVVKGKDIQLSISLSPLPTEIGIFIN